MPLISSMRAKIFYNTKEGKATGPDKISVEELGVLGDFVVRETIKLLNDIYSTGCTPN